MPIRLASLAMAPLAAAERIGGLLDSTIWRSLSDDPQLLAQGDLAWDREAVFLFEADVMAIEGASGVPMLYFDFGNGFEAASAIAMSRSRLSYKAYSVAVRLRAPPRRIRFDPCSAPGEFMSSDLLVRLLGDAEAAGTNVMTFPLRERGARARPSERSATRATTPRMPQTAVILHLFYEELWQEMAGYIENVPSLDRLYVSIPMNASRALEESITQRFPVALVRRVPNRGRDVLPFLQWLDVAALHGIEVVCKIHTKRSPHVPSGEAWRHDLLDKLLGSPAAVLEALSSFHADPRLGILAPAGHVVPSTYYWERNARQVELLCQRMGKDLRDSVFDYVAGSMFWGRVAALAPLRRLHLRDEDFETESGAVDGALHHALERCFPVAAGLAGFTMAQTRNAAHSGVHDFAPPPPKPRTYATWIQEHEVPQEHHPRLRALEERWNDPPLISLVMPTYNTPDAYLVAAIESVLAQVYPRWELCIADDASPKPHVRKILEDYCRRDPRIKVAYRKRNGHIVAASNSALELASGSFVALLDHDDALHPLALHFVAEAIVENPRCELVYTDEDKIGLDGARQDPYFKSDLNYELLLAHNMICHLGCYRTSRVRHLGGFRAGFEGAQDYDLALRFIEGLEPSQVVHVPHVLYHWRVLPGSTAMASDEKPYAQVAGRKAVAEHLERIGVPGQVVPAPEAPAMNRVRFALPSPAPAVTIVIPTRDRADLLALCLDSLLERTSYENFSVLVVDNGSTQPETFKLFERLRARGVAVRRDESEFNFSALNNRAVDCVSSEFVCLMNNDIEIVTPDWLEEMVGMAARPGVGAVGARLWYPDGRLQHGGAIVGIGGVAGHSHKYLPRGKGGYFNRAVLHQAMTAVTAACLVVRRRAYQQVGGLDETLKVAFNDIDFCLKLRAAGYRNVWTPYAEMIHHESASRGHETSPEKQARFNSEIDRMKARWGEALLTDPAYSPNLTLEHEDFSLAWPPRVQVPATDEHLEPADARH